MRARSLLLALAVLSVACSPTADESRTTAVATVFPLAWLVEAVAPDAALTVLGANGGDAHDLDLTPSQRRALDAADVVAYVGGDFQHAVEEVVEARDDGAVALVEVAGDRVRRVDGALDPHLWLDGEVMAAAARAVGDAFAAADPGGAEGYRERADAAAAALADAAGKVDALLADCRHAAVVVSHEAYGYLLEPHGVEQLGIAGLGGHAEATPQRVVELAGEIRRRGLPAVVGEEGEALPDAEALAAEAGVELLVVRSLETGSEEDLRRGYPALLLEQADVFADALECG